MYHSRSAGQVHEVGPVGELVAGSHLLCGERPRAGDGHSSGPARAGRVRFGSILVRAATIWWITPSRSPTSPFVRISELRPLAVFPSVRLNSPNIVNYMRRCAERPAFAKAFGGGHAQAVSPRATPGNKGGHRAVYSSASCFSCASHGENAAGRGAARRRRPGARRVGGDPAASPGRRVAGPSTPGRGRNARGTERAAARCARRARQGARRRRRGGGRSPASGRGAAVAREGGGKAQPKTRARGCRLGVFGGRVVFRKTGCDVGAVRHKSVSQRELLLRRR